MAFVDAASAYGAVVRVSRGETTVDGKSIMEMMMLAATCGSEIEVVCEGDDAEDCLSTLSTLVAEGFGEE